MDDYIPIDSEIAYAQEIRRVMERERWTVADLVKRTGLTRYRINNLLNYSPKIRVRDLAAIALVCNLRWTTPHMVECFMAVINKGENSCR